MNEFLLGVLPFALLEIAFAMYISCILLFFYFFGNKKLRNAFGAIFGGVTALIILALVFFKDAAVNIVASMGAAVLPALPLVWFFVSLVRFLVAPKGSDERRSSRISLICSVVVSVVICGGMMYLLWSFAQGIANM